jgi:tight adherence protein C
MSQLLQAGRTRRQVIDELSRRNPTPIIRSFAAAIDQNQTLGTPLAAVLRKQAETTRRHRRQAAETRAAAVSMKMIFPTVFCILPLLMIVVVGPAIVRLMEVL